MVQNIPTPPTPNKVHHHYPSFSDRRPCQKPLTSGAGLYFRSPLFGKYIHSCSRMQCASLPREGISARHICRVTAAAAAAAKSLQSCPTLCNPIDNSPLGSSVAGILQARILEWVAISFSKGYSRDRQLSGTQGMAGSQMCKFRKLHMRLAHYCQE